MTCAAVRLGIAHMISSELMIDIQTKTGIRNGVIPGARFLMTVTSMFMPVAIVPTLVTISAAIQ